jgi:hypothetical protein
MSTVRKDLNRGHEDAAARVLKALKQMGDPLDAQITLAVVSLFICYTRHIQGDSFISHLRANMENIAQNEQVLVTLMNNVSNQVSGKIIMLPPQAGRTKAN